MYNRNVRIPPFEITYLVLLPFAAIPKPDSQSHPVVPKGAPYFFNLDIEVKELDPVDVTVNETVVHVRPQLVDKQIWIAECKYVLSNPFAKDSVIHMQRVQLGLRQQFMKAAGLDEKDGFEEYTVIHLQSDLKTPDQFVDAHADSFAQLLRNLDKPLEKREITKTLSTRIRYSQNDLSIVDWYGAILLTDDGDITSDIDLFKVGNYQLLRYRLLDKYIELSLEKLQGLINQKRFTVVPRRDELMYQILNKRLEIILSFEKINQELLQIGDWYSAELYRTIVDELYVNVWKETVSTKLESLGSIHEIVSQNLTLTWSRLLDFVQLFGWLILLVGYFVLFYFDITMR